MLSDPTSRRAFLAASGAALAAAWLGADPEQLEASLARAGAARTAAERGEQLPAFEVLTAEQAADLDAITAQIFPTDDLPGAREARVVYFLDHALATWAQNQRELLIAGLAMFNGAVAQRYASVQRFAQLTADQQLEFLHANEQNPFFQQLRFPVIAAMFSNPSWGGNYDKAGWRLLGFDDQYVWQAPFGWYDARANGGEN